eukprot:7013595-Prymnesium_polylepis.1
MGNTRAQVGCLASDAVRTLSLRATLRTPCSRQETTFAVRTDASIEADAADSMCVAGECVSPDGTLVGTGASPTTDGSVWTPDSVASGSACASHGRADAMSLPAPVRLLLPRGVGTEQLPVASPSPAQMKNLTEAVEVAEALVAAGKHREAAELTAHSLSFVWKDFVDAQRQLASRPPQQPTLQSTRPGLPPSQALPKQPLAPAPALPR